MDDVAAPTRTRTRWLTPSVIGFGLASFLSDAGHEAATAALPGLLLLLGAQPAALGIIEGVSDGLSSFAKLAGGVGDLLSSAMVGIAWSTFGAPAGFTIAAVLCAAGTVSLVLHSSRTRGRAGA